MSGESGRTGRAILTHDRPHRPRLDGLTPPARLRTALVLAVAGVLLLDACGGGDDGADASEAASQSRGGDAGAEPAADPDDPDAVRPYVEELLEDYDRVVNAILTDPGVAADREDLLVQQYLELFEPSSDFADGALEAWAANGEAGIALLPYSGDHPTNSSEVDGDIEVVSGDEVRFPICIEQRYLRQEGGRVVEGVPLKEQPGEVVAVRVEGEWRLQRRDVFGNVVGCDTLEEQGA